MIDLRDDVVIHVVLGSDSTRMARDIAQLDRGHSDAARIAEISYFTISVCFKLFYECLLW